MRRLHPRETAERGGNPNRAAGIRSDRGGRESCCDRDRRSAARTAGDAMNGQVPRIPRRAHRRVAAPSAERELHHVRLAERNHPGCKQARHDGRCDVGLAAEPALRARGRLMSRVMEQVLESDRQAVQRTPCSAGVALEIGRLCERARFVRVDVDVCVQSRIERGNARENRFDEVARRNGARREETRELGERCVDRIGHGPEVYSSRRPKATLTPCCRVALRGVTGAIMRSATTDVHRTAVRRVMLCVRIISGILNP